MKSEDPLDRLRQTCESLGIKQPPPTDNSLEREVILALRSALTIVRPGSLLDGAIRSTLSRCEQEWTLRLKRVPNYFVQAKRAAKMMRFFYLCTVCHHVPVDADSGYDTCPDCLRRQ